MTRRCSECGSDCHCDCPKPLFSQLIHKECLDRERCNVCGHKFHGYRIGKGVRTIGWQCLRQEDADCKCQGARSDTPVPDPTELPADMYGNINIRNAVLEKVKEERLEHRRTGFNLSITHLQWLQVLSEELGEISKALREEPWRIEEETTQLAAAAVAYLEACELARRRKAARKES